jgi:hypothetical protein
MNQNPEICFDVEGGCDLIGIPVDQFLKYQNKRLTPEFLTWDNGKTCDLQISGRRYYSASALWMFKERVYDKLEDQSEELRDIVIDVFSKWVSIG